MDKVSKGNTEFINLLTNEKPIAIVVNNWPDYDSIAAAYGLQFLLKENKINSIIYYEGEIKNNTLKKFIKTLTISLLPFDRDKLKDRSIILTGGHYLSNKIIQVKDNIILIFNNIKMKLPAKNSLKEIYYECGACSTIIYEYLNEVDFHIPQMIYSALFIGVGTATKQLTSSVSDRDVNAYSHLYKKVDIEFVNNIVRTDLQPDDVVIYREVLDKVKIQNRFIFFVFEQGCDPLILNKIGTFFLILPEVDLVVLFIKNNDEIITAAFTDNLEWDAAVILENILEDKGQSSGNKDRAFGIIEDPATFDEKVYFDRIMRKVKS